MTSVAATFGRSAAIGLVGAGIMCAAGAAHKDVMSADAPATSRVLLGGTVVLGMGAVTAAAVPAMHELMTHPKIGLGPRLAVIGAGVLALAGGFRLGEHLTGT